MTNVHRPTQINDRSDRERDLLRESSKRFTLVRVLVGSHTYTLFAVSRRSVYSPDKRRFSTPTIEYTVFVYCLSKILYTYIYIYMSPTTSFHRMKKKKKGKINGWDGIGTVD
ncbi:hypothetical protein EUTSA_v10023767mg [Eutrema salsugineum]|uniref:Transmembrane protein n=1 Tax=Eutrema salsugineum TaxID=72664 RepID=V4JU48_EUTSA|nr:hypothetical protein EUTSA_v10023767mg [Eutrema salsugineum]